MARPSSYTDAAADEIIGRLSKGEPLAVICRDNHLVCDDTVRNWADADEEFAKRYARARRAGFDAIALRARLTMRGKTEAEGGESTADVHRDKAIVDLDLKLLSKWDPKRYGDAVQVKHADADGGKLPEINETDAAARIAALLGLASMRKRTDASE